MRAASKLRAAALAALVAAALGACSSDEKPHTATPVTSTDSGSGIFIPVRDSGQHVLLPDGGVPGCGEFGRVAACTACLRQKCCQVASECAKVAGCTANVGCIRACDGKSGDAGTACFQACADEYFSAAGVQYNDLVSCMNSSCAAACPFTSP